MKLRTLLCLAFWVVLSLAMPARHALAGTGEGFDLSNSTDSGPAGRSALQQATPVATMQLSPTPPPQEKTRPPGRPTRTPRPTSTPLTIPPPSNLDTNNMMIAFGVFVVIIIIAGLLINRDRTLG